MARPTILTPELAEQIAQHIRAGAYAETAAAAAGIHKETFYAWLRDGAREKRRIAEDKPIPTRNGKRISKAEQERLTMCAAFSDAINEAIAAAELTDIAIIGRAARGVPQTDENGNQTGWLVTPQWQAAAWRLERKNPRRWGRTDKHEISGRDGEPVKVDQVITMSEEAISMAAQRLLESGVELP